MMWYEFIEKFDRDRFVEFLLGDSKRDIFYLLDNNGLQIINNSVYKAEIIKCILKYNRYKASVLNKKDFVKLALSVPISDLYVVISELDIKIISKLIDRAISIGIGNEIIAQIICTTKVEDGLDLIKKFENNTHIKYYLIRYGKIEFVKYIIDNYKIDLCKLSDYGIKYQNFFKMLRDNQINISNNLINKKLAKKIYESYDIYMVRSIINDMEYVGDSSIVNDYVKGQEDMVITSYKNGELVYPYKEIYNLFLEMINNEKYLKLDEVGYGSLRNRYIFLLNVCRDKLIFNKLNEIKNKEGIEEVFKYLENLSKELVSNYIIDYHFEENYYNVMIDMRELLNSNNRLSRNVIYLYQRILLIDKMNLEQKLLLHKDLKQYNMKELFYDSLVDARRMVGTSIKNAILTKSRLNNYLDPVLTQKYGVDVYVMDGAPFFGLVSGNENDDNRDNVVGRYYSLVGRNHVAIMDINSHKYLYDGGNLHPEQVVHVFPMDTYMGFSAGEPENLLMVNTLYGVNELLGVAKDNPEVVVAEDGSGLIDRAKELQKIAVYCVDEVTMDQVMDAQYNNLGIILVKSDKYQKKDMEIDDDYFDENIKFEDYIYFNNIYTDERQFKR